jgi:hypothetical protein
MTYRRDVLGKLDVDNPSAENGGVTGGIPFMGIHLSDLIFIEEANGKDRLPNGMINFAKMRYV